MPDKSADMSPTRREMSISGNALAHPLPVLDIEFGRDFWGICGIPLPHP
jgi:hypothetical protein